MTFSNWTVGKKLGFTSAAALLLTGILAGVAIREQAKGIEQVVKDVVAQLAAMVGSDVSASRSSRRVAFQSK